MVTTSLTSGRVSSNAEKVYSKCLPTYYTQEKTVGYLQYLMWKYTHSTQQCTMQAIHSGACRSIMYYTTNMIHKKITGTTQKIDGCIAGDNPPPPAAIKDNSLSK